MPVADICVREPPGKLMAESWNRYGLIAARTPGEPRRARRFCCDLRPDPTPARIARRFDLDVDLHLDFDLDASLDAMSKLSALPRAKLLETAQHGDGRRRRHRAAGHRPDGLRAGGECSARRRAGRSAASTVWCVRLHLYQVRWKWHRALRLWSAPCSDIPPLGRGRYLWGNSALCGLDWRLSHRLCLC